MKSLRHTTGFLIMIAAVNVNAQAKILVLEHVNVIPMDKQQVLNDHRAVVVDDKVSLIEPASNKLKVKVDEIIDSRGHYMIPGLSDTHFQQSS
jgi:cytosine/adenosine deaminase-related metal-dependent hydrolase|tara:strand:+ start:218 stop:496 length:279 start_codon:yes stop_codon:yes gene_type:complete